MTKKERIGVRALRDALPGVLERVQVNGERVEVTRNQEVVAELVPVSPTALPQLPRIITLASLKGGVGKTTLTMHLAAVLAEEGQRVTVIDADDEKSATRWADEARQHTGLTFEVREANRDALMRQARDLARSGQTVVIDTPPNNREILKSAAMVAELVLVPLLPSGVDIDRVATTLVLLADIAAVRDEFNYALVVNRYEARTLSSKEVIRQVQDLPSLKTYIATQTLYTRAFGKQPEALEPFRSIWQEIKESFEGDQ